MEVRLIDVKYKQAILLMYDGIESVHGQTTFYYCVRPLIYSSDYSGYLIRCKPERFDIPKSKEIQT